MSANIYKIRQRQLVICILLVIAVLVVYGQVKKHDFINCDDELYVTENYHVKNGLTFKNVIWAFSAGYATNWHPITWLSHMLDFELYGSNPMGHHWKNVQIHVANTILVFLVFNWMTGVLWQSSVVAALFALHPLHVESVAWVAERKDVLRAFFWILSMWAYVRHPYLFTGWFWYLGTLFPVIGLIHAGSQSMAERYTYIPPFGAAGNFNNPSMKLSLI